MTTKQVAPKGTVKQKKAWAPKTLPCPMCEKDVALTQTGKFWSHDVPPEQGDGACPASGKPPAEVPYEGRVLVRAAKQIAFEVHASQKDKAGEPYHLHLTQTAMGVRVFAGDAWVAIASAYLHDSIEDWPEKVNSAKLLAWGLPSEVIATIVAVTKKSGQKQEDFLDQVIAGGRDAMLVNLADTISNTRPDRLAVIKKKLGEAVVTRLLKKYRPRIARLLLELGTIADEETQKKLSTTPVGTGGYSTTTYYASGDPNWYSGGSLFVGDWLAGHPCAIQATKAVLLKGPKGGKGKKGHLLTLEDGSQWTVEDGVKYKAWTRDSTKAAIAKAKKEDKDSTWTPEVEKQETKEAWEARRPKASKTPVKSVNAYGQTTGPTVIGTPPQIVDYGLCGTCGGFTHAVENGTMDPRWLHDETVTPWHSITRPTKERLVKLVAEGVITQAEADSHEYIPPEPKRSVCGLCGDDTELKKGYSTWTHVRNPAPYHMVAIPTEERLEALILKRVLTDEALKYAEPESSRESICGECGQATHVTGGGSASLWSHYVQPTSLGQTHHSVTRPTRTRLNKLVEAGVITVETAKKYVEDAPIAPPSEEWWEGSYL